MSASKELGVNLHGQQSADSIGGLPIKKRKYHIVQSPSPTRMSSLLPEEIDLLQKDESISELEIPVSGTALTLRGYSLADARSSTFGHMNMGNENSLGLNLQLSDVSCSSTSQEESACKRELIPEDELKFQRVDVDSGLLLSQKDTFQQPIGEKISKGRAIMSSSSLSSNVLENTELLSTFKEPHGYPTECQNIGGGFPEHKKLYQSAAEYTLRDFTLFEEEIIGHTKGNVTESKDDCDNLNKSRPYWDLNATMDAWEGFNMTKFNDKKPEVFSEELAFRERVDNHVTSTKCLHVDAKDGKQLFDLLSCFDKDSCPPAKLNRMKNESDYSNVEEQILPGNMNSFICKPIKSEQLEWEDQGDFRMVENHNQLMQLKTPKSEVPDKITKGGLQTVCKNKLVNPGGIKSEPDDESGQMVKVEEQILHQKIHKLTPELTINEEAAQGATETIKAIDLVPGFAGPDAKESHVSDCMLDAAQITCSTVSYPHCAASIYCGGSCSDSTVTCGADGSGDNRRSNISADIHEDDPNDGEHESDSPPNVDMVVVRSNSKHNSDDFEDGEVRELLAQDTSADVMCEEGETGQRSHGDPDKMKLGGSGDPTDGGLISSHVESTDCTAEKPTGSKSPTGVHDSNGCIETKISCIQKKEESCTTVPQLKKSSASGAVSTGHDKKRSIKVIHKTLGSRLGKKEHGIKSLETNSNQAIGAVTSHESVIHDGKEKTSENQESVKGLADSKVSHSKFSKGDTSVRFDKETRNNQRRIINLSQACNRTSPGRTISLPDAPTVLHTERGRVPHKSFRIAELHLQGRRDESCIDGHGKLERDYKRDRLAGNSGLDFMHMKGQVDNSFNTQCNWDSDRDFSSGRYSSLTGVRVPRAKNIAAIADAELEFNGLVIDPDGSVVNPGMPWRRHVQGELDSFHQPPFRGRSPGLREGPKPLRLRMIHRPLRTINPDRCISRGDPDRCISRGDPDMVVVRHEEELMRGLPYEMMDPLLPHSQSQYERVHNPLIRREKSLSPVQLRSSVRVPQICSKSPPRARPHSPCSWPSPGRSPNQFDGHPELFLRRSPPAFRGGRTGSPHQRPCLTDAMMMRQCGSPPHIPQFSDEMRNMGRLREREHLRQFVLNRRPSGRILQRSRRFDMIDNREVVEVDEYFGPLRSGQFHELGVDDCVSDRRKCPERYGPIRSFRPIDNNIDVETFPHREESSRSSRFCPGADGEFHEKGRRGSPRDFEARILNQLGKPRRPRKVDEQEHNESSCSQEQGESSFNGNGRVKRGRL